jgi:threonine dehydrogenase-like Zn-dependent dehydrogenase
VRTAVFYGGADIRIEHRPEPHPRPGEVAVAVRAAGICGSDLHRYRGHDPWGTASGPAAGPRRAGHEFAGVVVALGDGVDGLAVGQPVVVEPMQLAGCGRCPACRRGATNLCPERGLVAGRRWVSTGFAEIDVARADHVFPVPNSLPLAVAALADVYACAIHALHRAPVADRDTVLVIGTGPLGLALGQVARLAGAHRIILAGRRSAPLDLALAIGAADLVVDTGGARDLATAVREQTGCEGVDVVFEAVGGVGDEPVRLAVGTLAAGGTLCLLGAYMGDIAVPYREANDREIRLLWSNGYAAWHGVREFAIALDWLARGRVEAAPLVTHRFPLARIAEAFRTADRKAETGAVKVVVEP